MAYQTVQNNIIFVFSSSSYNYFSPTGICRVQILLISQYRPVFKIYSRNNYFLKENTMININFDEEIVENG